MTNTNTPDNEPPSAPEPDRAAAIADDIAPDFDESITTIADGDVTDADPDVPANANPVDQPVYTDEELESASRALHDPVADRIVDHDDAVFHDAVGPNGQKRRDEQQEYAPEPQPYRRPRLCRSVEDRRIGGVAAGLANWLNLDPTIVRIAVLATAISGIGIFMYLAAWIILPDAPHGYQPPRGRRIDFRNADPATLTLIVVAGVLGAFMFESVAFLALVLLLGGFWLLSQQARPDQPEATITSSRSAPETPYIGADARARPDQFGSTAGSLPAPAERSQQTYAPTPFSAAPWPVQDTVHEGANDRTPRPPQKITRVVLALLAMLGALALAAGAGDWWDVSPSRILGIGVVLVGGGVILGALRNGGARWLIPLGMFGLLLLIPASVAGSVFADGVGERVYRPTTGDALPESIRLGAGELIVDLRLLDIGELARLDRDLDIEVGFGQATVLLPAELGGTVDLSADAGQILVDGPGMSRLGIGDNEGIRLDIPSLDLPGETGDLRLSIDVGIGVAELRSR